MKKENRLPKRILADILGISAMSNRIDELEMRIDQLEELVFESREDLWDKSRKRWLHSKPSTDLTWRRDVTGDNFISKVSAYNVFGPEKTILEIGPGYGRLLTALLEKKIPFKRYVGVDISPENIEYLRENFLKANVNFIQGDVEKVSLDERFDIVLSSLTFKHLFPSFEKALLNLVEHVNPGGAFFFDLIEGRKRYFEKDGVTYIRWYTRSEISKILDHVSLELVAFDQVQHHRDYFRLLVVAKKLV